MASSSVSRSAYLSSLVALLMLTLVVDDVSSSFFKFKNKARSDPVPLYGVVLHGHPYPRRAPFYPSPHSAYIPHYPNKGIIITLPDKPPQYVPLAPTNPYPYLPQVPYTSPTLPPYRPRPQRPVVSNAPYQARPYLPVPTTFDVKPWRPITTSVTSADYVLDANVQLNTLDGYPWTKELQQGAETEAIRSKLPSPIFYPEKSLAAPHAASSNIDFIPNPELSKTNKPSLSNPPPSNQLRA